MLLIETRSKTRLCLSTIADPLLDQLHGYSIVKCLLHKVKLCITSPRNPTGKSPIPCSPLSLPPRKGFLSDHVLFCKVTVVEIGRRALQYLGLEGENSSIGFDGVKVNLIMTDCFMPGMTGYELLKKIKIVRRSGLPKLEDSLTSTIASGVLSIFGDTNLHTMDMYYLWEF